MNKTIIRCKEYVTKVLSKQVELSDYIGESTILLNVYYEDDKVWDLMILLDDDWFKYEFAHLYGENFVVDDHEHKPPAFTRVKSYKWLRDDFAKRLHVALWIFQSAIVIQEKENLFRQVITEQKDNFCQNLHGTIKRKYLELRSDRHNLRHSVTRPDDMANTLLKANIVKLCFELSLLANGKPYPFRILLPDYAKNNTTNGNEIFILTQKFLAATNPEITILLSDKLIGYIVTVLQKTKLYSEDFLLKWWLYLD